LPAPTLTCRHEISSELEIEITQGGESVQSNLAIRKIQRRVKRKKYKLSQGIKTTEGEPFGLPFRSGGKDDFGFCPLCNPVHSARLNLPDFRLLIYYQALIVPTGDMHIHMPVIIGILRL